jgi:type I restriction-modification system DNA methylase subunit
MEEMKMKAQSKFSNIMSDLASRHNMNTIFSDFLTLCICAFSLGKIEDQYKEIISKYSKAEANQLASALGALVIEMTGEGYGMVDVLGEFFENNLSYGKNGQFFTPQNICDLMAQVLYSPKSGSHVADPACGSGRMLMAMAKLNRNALYFGADISEPCAKMATLNLYLNHIFGEIAWMDSLSNKFYCGWSIEPTIKGLPRIREITAKESYIHLKLPAGSDDNGKDNKLIELPRQKQLIFEL